MNIEQAVESYYRFPTNLIWYAYGFFVVACFVVVCALAQSIRGRKFFFNIFSYAVLALTLGCILIVSLEKVTRNLTVKQTTYFLTHCKDENVRVGVTGDGTLFYLKQGIELDGEIVGWVNSHYVSVDAVREIQEKLKDE